MHVHRSLWRDGANVFHDPDGWERTSAACRSYAAARRLKFRLADPSAQPYLALVGILLAGLDGVRRRPTCPARPRRPWRRSSRTGTSFWRGAPMARGQDLS